MADRVGWDLAQANYIYHDNMHFDDEEKELSDFHGHFLMNLDDDRHGIAKAKINQVLKELVGNGYLSLLECTRILLVIQAFRGWQPEND